MIGTSLVVYPAAGLIRCVPFGKPIYYIDPHPADTSDIPGVHVIAKNATEGMRDLIKILVKE